MTTASEALTAIKAQLAAGFTDIPVRWGNDNDGPVPDEPTAFVYAHFVIDREGIAGYGGGRGANLWRNFGYVDFIVLTPINEGMEDGISYAEDIASVFRGQRIASPEISFWECEVSPGARDPDNGNYWRTVATVTFTFDRTA